MTIILRRTCRLFATLLFDLLLPLLVATLVSVVAVARRSFLLEIRRRMTFLQARARKTRMVKKTTKAKMSEVATPTSDTPKPRRSYGVHVAVWAEASRPRVSKTSSGSTIPRLIAKAMRRSSDLSGRRSAQCCRRTLPRCRVNNHQTTARIMKMNLDIAKAPSFMTKVHKQ